MPQQILHWAIHDLEEKLGRRFEYPPEKEPELTPQLLAALEEYRRDMAHETSREFYLIRDYPPDHDFQDPEVPSYA